MFLHRCLSLAALAAVAAAPAQHAVAGKAEKKMEKASDAAAAAMADMTPKQQAEMKAWQETMAPSKGHELLQPFVGKWTTTNTMWMSPDAEPSVQSGTSEARWILGGRFVEQVHRGQWMDMPFEGRGLTGYDNVLKKYVGTWVDNFGTGVMSSTGHVDPTGKWFEFIAEYPNPLTGKTMRFRETIDVQSDDRHVFTMYMNDETTGEEFKHMEIVYTRVGRAAGF